MRKVIAVDFDGCISSNAWPDIGKPDYDIIDELLKEQLNGTALILWTCRCGDKLQEAVEACRDWGLQFEAVNANVQERVDFYGTESRKVSADEYWDDRALVKRNKHDI